MASQEELIKAQKELLECSDDLESLDSDGYSKKDPYASAAKIADKKIKLKDELIKNRVVQLTDKVLANREKITWMERRAKNLLVVGILGFFVYQVADQSSLENWTPNIPLWELLSLEWVVEMKHELSILLFSVGLFATARTYNNYLDQQEELEKELDHTYASADESPESRQKQQSSTKKDD